MLNLDSPVPLYRQLADRLSAAIERGRFPVGERIPSEHELSRRYGVGRPTVRQATEVLVRRGLLQRRRGAGTFVCERPAAHLDLFSMAGTHASFRAGGCEPRIRVLTGPGVIVADEHADHPFAGRSALFLQRLSETDQGPALLEEILLDLELFEGLQDLEIEGRSLSRLVEEHYGQRPIAAPQDFRVATLEPERAAVLHVRRHLHFPGGRDAVYAELFCRSDRVELTQHIGAMP